MKWWHTEPAPKQLMTREELIKWTDHMIYSPEGVSLGVASRVIAQSLNMLLREDPYAQTPILLPPPIDGTGGGPDVGSPGQPSASMVGGIRRVARH